MSELVDAFREEQRLHPMTLLQRVVVSLPGLLLVIFTTTGGRDPQGWIYLLLLAMYGFVALPLMVLHYLRFRFRISERDLQIDSGVLTRRRRSIPIERIQNIEIQRPLIARLTGTAKVRVETGGSAGAEGVLELIGLHTAHRLRDALRAYQRALLTTGEQGSDQAAVHTESPATDAVQDDRALYTMSVGRVLLSGVFRFSLFYIVVMFSGLEYLNVDAADLFDLVESGPLRPFAEFASESPLAAILISLGIASLVAWLTGILVNLNRFYRFRLNLRGDKLHTEQGLVTLHEGAIPTKRIQAFILRTNPLMRRFGWWALDVQTLGLEASRRGRSTIVPFARRDETLAILQMISGIHVPATFHSVSTLTIRRRGLRYALVILIVSGILSLVVGWSQAAWVLVAIPIGVLVAYGQYRNHGYVETDDELIVRAGLMRHQIWLLPTQRQQVFYASSTLFQRRLGLGSLEVDVAGAPSWGSPRIVDLPRESQTSLFGDLIHRFHRAWNRGAAEALEPIPTSSSPPEPPS